MAQKMSNLCLVVPRSVYIHPISLPVECGQYCQSWSYYLARTTRSEANARGKENGVQEANSTVPIKDRLVLIWLSVQLKIISVGSIGTLSVI
jgi:hypothetical protein